MGGRGVWKAGVALGALVVVACVAVATVPRGWPSWVAGAIGLAVVYGGVAGLDGWWKERERRERAWRATEGAVELAVWESPADGWPKVSHFIEAAIPADRRGNISIRPASDGRGWAVTFSSRGMKGAVPEHFTWYVSANLRKVMPEPQTAARFEEFAVRYREEHREQR